MISTQEILESEVRRTISNGIEYFSLIDITKFWFSPKHSRTYWYDFKNYLRQRGNTELIEQIKPMKLVCPNLKRYFTDCADLEMCQKIVAEMLLRQRKYLNRSVDSETSDLHPFVERLLNDQGWITYHHYRLPSGREIDFLANKNSQTLIIECKRSLAKGEFFRAVGQVLCYQVEYGHGAIPVIAAPTTSLNNYIYEYTAKLGIDVLEIV